jgi:hypothetical protein
MVDFLKTQTYNTSIIDYFDLHPLLLYNSNTDKLKHMDNEVLTTKKVKQFKGIYFCFYPNRLDILFKPHYYFNDNLHNANDFKIVDCINVLNEFKNTFNIELTNLKVVNIEFGLNVISPIDIKDLIRFLAYHERNEFRTDTGLAYSKKSSSIDKYGKTNDYKIIKAYAKGIHFPNHCNFDTFRFEIKSKQSKYINTLNVFNLKDLLNSEVYDEMIKTIIKEFKEVLILDCSSSLYKLNPKEQKKINEFLNPLYWYKIINQNRNSFSKNKKIYYNLIGKIENNLKSQLEKIIFDKLKLLKEGAISTSLQEYKKGADSNIIYSRICTNNKTSICNVTGLDISMQKDNSILLSHTGLKYYHHMDKKIFEQIKRKYLSKVWFNSDFQTQIKEIAHNIRNTKSNQSIKQNRIYQPEQLNFITIF